MNITRFSSSATLRELIAWCEFAQDSLQASLQSNEADAIQRLKLHFLREHEAHLAQLREWARGDSSRRSRKPGFGQDLQIALRSSDADVVASACFLLERSLLAAYTRATDRLLLDAGLRRVISRQRVELKCSLEHYLRRSATLRDRRSEAAREVEAAPNVGALLTAAS